MPRSRTSTTPAPRCRPSRSPTRSIGHLQREARIGGYEAAAEAHERLDAVYDELAALLGCDADEIAVVENATRAWDMAFYALPFAAGDRILCARAEYESNDIAFLQIARRTGAKVEYVPNDEHGQLSRRGAARDGRRARQAHRDHARADATAASSTRSRRSGGRARGGHHLPRRRLPVGRPAPVDVRAIGCDMLSATGRKYLRGPRGDRVALRPARADRRARAAAAGPPRRAWVADDRYEIRPDARRFENWETTSPASSASARPRDYAREWGLEAIAQRVGALAARLRDGLAAVDGVDVHDLGLRKCGIVSLTVDGHRLRRRAARRWRSARSTSRSIRATTRCST